MQQEKSRCRVKVLVVGGTGYLGKRLVQASLQEGHDTFVLLRKETALDIDKVDLLLSFKKKGAHLVHGSFSDHRSLVDAVKKVNVVICAISGVSYRSHNILMQLKLIEAIKEAGNVKRFLPSEFGMDQSRMEHALEPGRVTFEEKMAVRKAIEDAGIPYTYIISNCFAGYFVRGMSQLSSLMPPEKDVYLYEDGHENDPVKAVFVDEDDIATYTMKTIDDPRALNKAIYIKPPENILSQRDLVQIWETVSGKELNKKVMSSQELLSLMTGANYDVQGIITRLYHIFCEGCLTNFEPGEDQEASKLYPQVRYTRMDEYLKRYV